MIEIFDDIVDLETQNRIKDTLFDSNFPWYYVPDVSYIENDRQQRPALKHYFVYKGETQSSATDVIRPLVEATVNVLGLENYKVEEVRSFLQFPLNKDFIGEGVDTPHLDKYHPHLVFLYYVDDSTAETIIYDYKAKDGSDRPYFEDIKELARVTPKKGRMVVFDGMYWHTAEQPKDEVRCIINSNITI